MYNNGIISLCPSKPVLIYSLIETSAALLEVTLDTEVCQIFLFALSVRGVALLFKKILNHGVSLYAYHIKSGGFGLLLWRPVLCSGLRRGV